MAEKQFIIWYNYDGEEDYTIITGLDEDEARRKFYGWHSESISIKGWEFQSQPFSIT